MQPLSGQSTCSPCVSGSFSASSVEQTDERSE
jgi:hypothetical protein